MEFVINLSSESILTPYNDYGYWAGKTYTVNREVFPVWGSKITIRTKKYKSRVRAESMAEKLVKKCSYFTKLNIEEVKE